MSNEYKAPGFEPTTSQMELSPITPRPRLPPTGMLRLGKCHCTTDGLQFDSCDMTADFVARLNLSQSNWRQASSWHMAQ